MDVVEETGGLIREPIITICELSDYAQGLDEKDKRQYVEKLVKNQNKDRQCNIQSKSKTFDELQFSARLKYVGRFE